LYQHENEKYRDMVQRILPGQISNRSMAGAPYVQTEVTKVAISYCDGVTFTPWCARTPAETVVNALHLMFPKVDECQVKYERVTKIKCIGDCYMAAAGVFLRHEETLINTEAARQMLRFCLDCIDAMAIVNRAFPPPRPGDDPLRVRIGIHYGGPVSAGVMGIHRPVFDIWGETVSLAEAMESSGSAMMVNISPEMYEKVIHEPFGFQLQSKTGTSM
jgi:class 3 adenylate cyclase